MKKQYSLQTVHLSGEQEDAIKKLLKSNEVSLFKMKIKELGENPSVNLKSTLASVCNDAKAYAKKVGGVILAPVIIYKVLVTDLMAFYMAYAIDRNKKEVKSVKRTREQIINRALGKDAKSAADASAMTGITMLGGSGKDPFLFLPPVGFHGEPIALAAFENYYHGVKVMDNLPGIRKFLPDDYLSNKDNYLGDIFKKGTPNGNLSYKELKNLSSKEIESRLNGIELFNFVQSVKCKEYYFKRRPSKEMIEEAIIDTATCSNNPVDYRILLKNGVAKDELVQIANSPNRLDYLKPKENFIRFANETVNLEQNRKKGLDIRL